MDIFNTTNNESQLEMLKLKIQQCHEDNSTHSMVDRAIVNATTMMGLFCSKIFDGLLCWDNTPAGAVAYQNCPSNVYGWKPDLYAYKVCEDNGEWYRHPLTQKFWTNYTTCIDQEDFHFRECIIWLSITCYSISLVAITAAMVVLYFFNVVNCNRTRAHMNLFAALGLNCITWIIWYAKIVRDADLLLENPVWCSLFTLLNMYFMCASYLWMFCEALNLHVALVVVFVDHVYTMKTFMLIGWVTSFVLTSAYGGTRVLLGDTERCMIDDSQAHYILTVPIGITIFISLCSSFALFLIKHIYLSDFLVRIIMILVNLFGVHYMLLPVHPPIGTRAEMIYAVFVTLLTSLQGLISSVLFCFTSADVLHQVRQDYDRRRRLHQERIQMTAATTGGVESVQGVQVEEHQV